MHKHTNTHTHTHKHIKPWAIISECVPFLFPLFFFLFTSERTVRLRAENSLCQKKLRKLDKEQKKKKKKENSFHSELS